MTAEECRCAGLVNIFYGLVDCFSKAEIVLWSSKVYPKFKEITTILEPRSNVWTHGLVSGSDRETVTVVFGRCLCVKVLPEVANVAVEASEERGSASLSSS